MIRTARFAFAAVGLTLAAISSAHQGDSFADRVRQHRSPRLTVVISIDQFRADYLRRLTDLFLPARQGGQVGGFKYLMTQGSYFVDARYGHFPLFTGPGHSIIMTGGYPYKTGIVANDWFDKGQHKSVYCVDDPRWQVVGAASGSKATPMGPLNLKSTTVGDELKMATNGASRCVSLSLKDRASILLGGHAQDVCIWFDDAGGRWISSTAYCRNGQLPSWVQAVNAQAIPDKALGTTWTPSVPPSALARAVPSGIGPKNEPYGMGLTFPHRIGADKVKSNYRAFTLTPSANAYVFETAKQAVLGEKLGRHEAPDVLTINLATNDYTGHAFGPYSQEALDVTVQTDRQLAGFLNFLDKSVPGGLSQVLFAVTADHGVVGIPENLEARDIPGDRVLEDKLTDAAEKALASTYGVTGWFAKGSGGYVEPYLSLSEEAIARTLAGGKATSRGQIEDVAARAVETVPGVYACYTRSQILEGRLPQTELARHIANGFYPKVAGDIAVVTEQLQFTDPGTPGPYVTTHGTPYAYDTHVPILIAGPGIRSGVWADPVSPADLAPTICALLGIELPSACDGTILRSALK